MQLDYEWSAIGTLIGAFMPEGLKLEGKRADTISFSSKYKAGQPGGLLGNLNTQAGLGFDKAEYMGLNVGATNIDARMQNGLLRIVPFTTMVNNGQLSFGGEADFKQKPALFKIAKPMHIVKDIQLNDEVTSKLLAKLNPIFSGAVGVRGIANFHCDTMTIPIRDGTKEDVDISGTVSLTQLNMQPTGLLGTILSATGAARGQSMTIHPTKFTVRNGYVSYDNMQLDVGDNPVKFSGSLPLEPDKRIENMSITLPYTSRGGTVRVGEEPSGRLITAHIKGTPRNPELDLGKLLQEELIQTGLELLFEKVLEK